MKQAWYFTQWFFSKCGWTELLAFLFVASLIPGVFVSNPDVKEIFQYISTGILLCSLVLLLYGSGRYLWKQYKREQAELFDVLKKEEIQK